MTPEQNAAEIKKISAKSLSLAQVYAGELALFNAAAIMGDGRKMDLHRANIHAVVDDTLDTNVRLFALAQGNV
jgi:hypothetical protein